MNRISCLLLSVALVTPAMASSHREAPAIIFQSSLDNTDLYAFRSPDAPNTVTIVANFFPLEVAANGPNFYRFNDNASYEIHIDNTGGAKASITYQFLFRTEVRDLMTFGYNGGPILSLDSPNLNERQFYTVNRIENGRTTSLGTFQVAPANIGPKSTPDYARLANAAIGALSGGGRVFAGPRDDPFFVDIGAISDLLTLRPLASAHKIPPIEGNMAGVDNLEGFNVHAIVIQIPIQQLTMNKKMPMAPTDANAVLGFWSTCSSGSMTTENGKMMLRNPKQVSRLGMPLVNEIVMSRKFKDIFNASKPDGDAALYTSNAEFRNRILAPEVPMLMNKLYGIDVAPPPRNDLVQVFLTGVPGKNQPRNVKPAEMLRLNVAVPVTPDSQINRLGVIAGDLGGFPNGRRLADDVVDAELRVAAGVLVPGYDKAPNNVLTDGVDANDKQFLAAFPYLALPKAAIDK